MTVFWLIAIAVVVFCAVLLAVLAAFLYLQRKTIMFFFLGLVHRIAKATWSLPFAFFDRKALSHYLYTPEQYEVKIAARKPYIQGRAYPVVWKLLQPLPFKWAHFLLWVVTLTVGIGFIASAFWGQRSFLILVIVPLVCLVYIALTFVGPLFTYWGLAWEAMRSTYVVYSHNLVVAENFLPDHIVRDSGFLRRSDPLFSVTPTVNILDTKQAASMMRVAMKKIPISEDSKFMQEVFAATDQKPWLVKWLGLPEKAVTIGVVPGRSSADVDDIPGLLDGGTFLALLPAAGRLSRLLRDMDSAGFKATMEAGIGKADSAGWDQSTARSKVVELRKRLGTLVHMGIARVGSAPQEDIPLMDECTNFTPAKLLTASSDQETPSEIDTKTGTGAF